MADDPPTTGEGKSEFTLRLDGRQMKVLHTALKSYYGDLGYKDRDLDEICKSILAELPSEDELNAIDLNLER